MIPEGLLRRQHQKFVYTEEGKLLWSDNFGPRARKGCEAGSKDSSGYLQVKLEGRIVLIHRLIWTMFHDTYPEQIDHIDRDRSNNRISNLRAATNTTNQHNCKLRFDNSTGFTGVHAKNGRFQARIGCYGKRVHLGTFDSVEEAGEAYENAKRIHHNQPIKENM